MNEIFRHDGHWKKAKSKSGLSVFSDEPIGCFPNLYIVADGMGGHKAGDKASSYAVNRFVELAKKEKKELPSSLWNDF